MHPNIAIGGLVIPSWYTCLFLGIIVATILVISCRPRDLPLGKRDIFLLPLLLTVFGLFGARILFILLHRDMAALAWADIFSPRRGGFAYFGALVVSVFVLWGYSAFKKADPLAVADYIMPFLMLSQAFVRVGCLLAGCCYGRPTDSAFGVVFKSVDKAFRHPTQAYEALLLLSIYAAGRIIYKYRKGRAGFTFLATLIMYGIGRFFIEYLRTDSPIFLFNITLAQVSCLLLSLLAGIILILLKSAVPAKKS